MKVLLNTTFIMCHVLAQITVSDKDTVKKWICVTMHLEIIFNLFIRHQMNNLQTLFTENNENVKLEKIFILIIISIFTSKVYHL